jgi:hypothetical protein
VGNRGRTIAALTVAAALLLMPASAPAKKNHKKPTKLGPVVTVTANGNEAFGTGAVSTAVATCPTGTVAFGGGFSFAEGDPQIAAIFESYRSAPESWTVSSLTGGPDVAAISAYAYCRSSTRQITEVSGTGAVPGGIGQTGSAAATCPAGSQLVAGGFRSTRTPMTRSTSFPQTNIASSGSTWSVISLNNGSQPQTLTAYSYCLPRIAVPVIVSSTTSAALADDKDLTATAPACPTPPKRKKGKKKRKKPPHRLLSAGGFSTPTRNEEPFVLFRTSLAGPAGWNSTAVNVSPSTATFSVTSQGICV